MTNREQGVEALVKKWGEIQIEKQKKIREIWELEYRAEKIREKLMKHGKNLELAENPAVVD